MSTTTHSGPARRSRRPSAPPTLVPSTHLRRAAPRVSTVGTRWYTIAEAAPVLGVSVDTVRRRLKRGELEARQVHTQHGPTWEVCLGIASTES